MRHASFKTDLLLPPSMLTSIVTALAYLAYSPCRAFGVPRACPFLPLRLLKTFAPFFFIQNCPRFFRTREPPGRKSFIFAAGRL